MIDELTRADAAARSCLDVSVWALPEHELVACLEAVHVLENRLAGVKLALVREVDRRGVAAGSGASSTAVWLRDRLRMSVPAARRLVSLAEAVDTGPDVIRDALATGVVSVEQCRVITDTVATIPAKAGPEAVHTATRLLVDAAGQFEPAALRVLGERILHHVAPDLADEADREALARQERRGSERRHLTWSTGAGGQVRFTGLLDAEAGALAHAALDPLCTPTGLDDTRNPGQRRADALTEVCRLALRTTELPDNGGDTAQIVVTTTFDTRTGQLGAGTLDTGARLTPETVRRLACDARILPAVLDGAGQVLDVGRQRRLITGPLRRALVLRDRGCAFPGCDRPPRWADGHHVHHWSAGGTTSLTNAVLLCRHHHRLIHHTDWQVRIATDGLPEFIPPSWLDPTGHPRRNTYHRRC